VLRAGSTKQKVEATVSAGCQSGPKKFWRIAAVFAATGAIVLSGCSSKSEEAGPTTATTAVNAEKVDAIANTVPEAIKSSGKLIVGVNIPYTPNEFKDPSGKIVGFDVDLMNAVAKTLGLKPDYRETGFEAIIPSIRAGDFNVGMSSFTDTKDREGSVDFVTYFEAGTLWAQRVGAGVDPNNACGLRVGVQYATIQETEEIPAKSQACTEAGKSEIHKVVYVSQDDLNAALIAGEVDAMTTDSPTAGFAIKMSGGALEPAGEVFDPAPYGWPVAKGSGLAESLRRALEHLMQTGEYRTIATLWGVEKGMVDKSTINGAVR
jgi:polar amino acid transport system substrate-binding protein